MIRAAAVAGLVVAAGVPAALRAQRPSPAAGVVIMAAASDPVYGGAGAVASIPLDRQLRLTGAATGGTAGRERRGRGELLLELVLDPETRGWAPRLAGGVAGVTGPRGGGYLLLVAGLERRRSNRSVWRVDVGVGGGLRVAASLVWRLAGH